jgi:hypothetical protein
VQVCASNTPRSVHLDSFHPQCSLFLVAAVTCPVIVLSQAGVPCNRLKECSPISGHCIVLGLLAAETTHHLHLIRFHSVKNRANSQIRTCYLRCSHNPPRVFTRGPYAGSPYNSFPDILLRTLSSCSNSKQCYLCQHRDLSNTFPTNIKNQYIRYAIMTYSPARRGFVFQPTDHGRKQQDCHCGQVSLSYSVFMRRPASVVHGHHICAGLY